MDGMRALRKRRTAHEVCQDTAHTVLSDERLSGTGSSYAEIIVKEYGDAGGLDDIFLVLPELQERGCGAEKREEPDKSKMQSVRGQNGPHHKKSET